MPTRSFSLSVPRHATRVLLTGAVALGLAACDKMKEPTTGQRIDSAIEKTETAAVRAGVETRKALAETEVHLRVGAEKTGVVAEKTADTLRSAGSSALALADDAALTAQVSAGLAQDPALSAIRIDVDTHAGHVTLSGPAPTQAALERATAIAQGVKGVASVTNRLRLAPG